MIPLMRNAFVNEEETKNALAEFVKRAPRFSMGEECAKFENQFAAWQGAKHALLFNSGGSANLALLQALCNLGRLKAGDHVGFSALTWSTNVMPILQMGLVPVPIDVDKNTANVMSHNLMERLNEVPLKAFFATNVLGFCGDLPKIKQLCDERGILYIEDNCEGLGGSIGGKKFGNWGLAATFSFFVAHHMSTIEGGMICTADEELFNMLKMVRANGWDRNLDAPLQQSMRKASGINDFFAKYSFYDLAFNFRPTEITGFLGQTQLPHLDQSIRLRQQHQDTFNGFINSNPDLLPIAASHIDSTTPFGLIILCQTPELREHYLKRFEERQIEIRPIIAGNMQNQPFYHRYVGKNYPLPGADFYNNCGFYCGNYPEMTDSEIATIGEALSR